MFLDYKLEKLSDVEISKPKIDSSCSMCGKCIENCHYHALVEMIDTIYVVDELCNGCGLCSYVCPSQSISEVKTSIGELFSGINSATGLTAFYEGKLQIGQAMATPIIKELIEKLPEDNATTFILDSPPGTACPVITTLSYADFIVLVTEPTPYSLENLKQTVEVIKQLDIKFGLVLNKGNDLYNSLIYDYIEQEHIPLLLEIPFDKSYAELYARGLILVEHDPEWKRQFQQVFTKIVEAVE